MKINIDILKLIALYGLVGALTAIACVGIHIAIKTEIDYRDIFHNQARIEGYRAGINSVCNPQQNLKVNEHWESRDYLRYFTPALKQGVTIGLLGCERKGAL